jgi:hypothetical protein
MNVVVARLSMVPIAPTTDISLASVNVDQKKDGNIGFTIPLLCRAGGESPRVHDSLRRIYSSRIEIVFREKVVSISAVQ